MEKENPEIGPRPARERKGVEGIGLEGRPPWKVSDQLSSSGQQSKLVVHILD